MINANQANGFEPLSIADADEAVGGFVQRWLGRYVWSEVAKIEEISRNSERPVDPNVPPIVVDRPNTGGGSDGNGGNNGGNCNTETNEDPGCGGVGGEDWGY